MACSSSCGSCSSERNSTKERGIMFRSNVAGILVTVLCLSALAALSGTNTAHAGDLPVVEITAKRFAFIPNRITLKKGETVKLRIHSEDVTHGFFLRPLKIGRAHV